MCCPGQQALAAEPSKLASDTYSGYFVMNTFEPDAAASFVLVTDQKQFEEIFHVAMVMGDKSHRLAQDAFKSNIVVAPIKRGHAFWGYKVEGVSEKDGVVELRYTATENKTEATFTCPLIVSIPKGKYTAIRFVENGKEVKKMEMPTEKKTAVENVAISNFVSGIRTALPEGWGCSLIAEEGKMGHPHGLGEPLFRVDFTNPKETFEGPGKTGRLHPSLRLHFHPVADRQQILKVIEAEKIMSWDIPVLFSETREYLIVTSPTWINQGHYTEEAKKLMAPLEEALKKHSADQK